MTFLLKVVIFRFHVSFRGEVYQTSLFQKISHPPKSFIRSASLAEWILFKTSFSLDSPIHHRTPRSLRMLAPEKTMLGRTLSFPFWRFGQFSGANCYSLRGGGGSTQQWPTRQELHGPEAVASIPLLSRSVLPGIPRKGLETTGGGWKS